MSLLSDKSHRRYNPLLGEWVLVSPHRGKRPWQGQQEAPASNAAASYDDKCYLCPGNTRITGDTNPAYTGTYVFQNDFPALQNEGDSSADELREPDPLFHYRAVTGESRVICFSPDHSKSLPQLSCAEIVGVINTWTTQMAELAQHYQWVQVFENKGAVMGCSNPHPHGQIWAQNQLPTEAAKIDANLKAYQLKYDNNLLLDYVARELESGERLVDVNDDWVTLVPFWACWPFELMLLPRFKVEDFGQLSTAQKASLAEILKASLSRYDNLFQCSFPYSMGWRTAPFNAENNQHWQLHAVFFPPLLRSASVKKFMVGYEMLAEAQRDITPEQAAQRLRDCSTTHYLES
ncbi:UDP-glucose--hexose-1-phosphate uridylyltransferase [Gilvimarinus polysaccharolyticus]|uniref:UDP-glucose--hexose-1-phosphate uridylyltransferase n=1 Tax=Gilvimarinus polysaccharolyticus TaxID=863921 RepID=UPI0006738077|nr:UDP-glucose--hexose-1-phosphate uridylyltransferase [Gilvimarinus polysaccharolyticus]